MNLIANNPWGQALIIFLAATIIGVAIIAALRPVVERMCGAIARLRLWWILPLALLSMAIPKYTTVAIDIDVVPNADVVAAPIMMPAALVSHSAFPWSNVLLAVWILGVLITAGRMILAQRRFLAKITWGPVRGTLPPLSGPAVVGAMRPRLIVPIDFATRYSATERRLMLLHEAVHMHRRDGLASLFMTLLLVLQWFNPLVHWASRTLCRDQESACDATVIARHPGALRSYAEALLKSHPEIQHLPLVCRWHAYHPTVQRIAMLKLHNVSHGRTRLATAILTFGALLSSAFVYAIVPSTIVVEPAAVKPAQLVMLPNQPVVPVEEFKPSPLVQPAKSLPVRKPAPVVLASAEATAQSSDVTLPVPPVEAVVSTKTNWDLPGRVTFRFAEIDLGKLAKLVSDMTRAKFTATEQLSGTKVTLKKRNVPLGEMFRVVLGCAGFEVANVEGSYTIVPKVGAKELIDPSACIDSNLQDGPETEQKASVGNRYNVALSIFDADQPSRSMRVTIPAGRSIFVPLDRENLVVCVPKDSAGALNFGCAIRPQRRAEGSGPLQLSPLFNQRVDDGTEATQEVVVAGRNITFKFMVSKAGA